ncbi:hypothetical protein [Pseudomonas brassicacearum]|uniref:hypothetical protein n=1 Tax=Pseudomonas brassicacearum TaxID=930166 RepID=UPI00030A2DA3|nr:hypothetical protein [Pseudomonas brassicacearum]ROM97925.1 hypothetical protein BK656_05380 [Pseudomonas brassicacearum]
MVEWWDGIQLPQIEPAEPPEAYSTPRDAVAALLENERCKRSYKKFPLNPQAAARAIIDASDYSWLEACPYFKLEIAVAGVDDYDSRQAIHTHLYNWAQDNWQSIESDASALAVKLFTDGKFYFSDSDAFWKHVKRWEPLLVDPGLRSMLISTLQGGQSDPESAVGRLRALQGNQSAAIAVFTAIKLNHRSFKDWDQLAQLMAQWAGEGSWGQLQYLLWRQEPPEVRSQTELIPIGATVREVVRLLVQFGIPDNRKAPFDLAKLSTETKATWRRTLKTSIGNDVVLRQLTAEALLWFTGAHEDRAALFAVLELYEDKGDIQPDLSIFLTHADALVRLRAATVRDIMVAEPDTMDLLLSKRGRSHIHVPEPPNKPARTWIADARIEELIEQTFDDVASRAGADIGRRLDMGEESHLILLLDRLSTACDSISDRLADLAIESHANERLKLSLQYRVVGKHEEGGPGIGAAKFSADICLLFEAHEADNCFARRGSLLQAKRLHRTKSRQGRGSYPIDVKQLADLSEQTLACFLLLLGPEHDGVRIPIIPARLVQDLIGRGQLSTQMSSSHAAMLGKSIGTWLLEDVIGLWTGDWGPEIVERAQGGPDREPFVMIKVVAERERQGPDGWANRSS